MAKEIILALVLAALFLGAIVWLIIYSRLQHRRTGLSAEDARFEQAAAPRAVRAKRGGMR
jgi:hypothetical protein